MANTVAIVKTRKYLKSEHNFKINKLETENDALEVMANCWLAEEDQIRLIYDNYDIIDLRMGWSKGFLDALFPMRDLC